MKIGIVLCSRKNSTRIPGKAFRKINGTPLIENLVTRLKEIDLPIVVAIPNEDVEDYLGLLKSTRGTYIYHGESGDPMWRMNKVASRYKFDAVVRVTHDKIFVEPELIKSAIEKFKFFKADYMFGSKFTEGSGFEIISSKVLKEASSKFKNVEYLSYAIRACAKNPVEFEVPMQFQSNVRLLIDYEEDLKVIEVILSQRGTFCTLREAIHFVAANDWLMKSNRLPKISYYTCAHNSEKWIQKAMESVATQKGFHESEYILVDDFSSDETPKLMAKFASEFKNVKWFRNQKNLGLASSSNVALEKARGKFIIRLDSDDFFTRNDAGLVLLKEIEAQRKEAIYPCNYFGSFTKVQTGDECHHVGGTIFDVRALNHIKFTEGLRGHEGLDVFLKAKAQLKIGYYKRPIFFYTQRPDSLSKTDPVKRSKIKKQIEKGIHG